MEFVCKICGFKFEKEKKPLQCPYCSRKGSIEKVKSANELIEEVSEELEKS